MTEKDATPVDAQYEAFVADARPTFGGPDGTPTERSSLPRNGSGAAAGDALVRPETTRFTGELADLGRRLAGEALMIQDIVGNVESTCAEHVASMPVRHGGSNADASLLPPDKHPERRAKADAEALDAAAKTLDRVEMMIVKSSLETMLKGNRGLNVTVREDLMDMIVRLTTRLGNEREIDCLACFGPERPVIEGNDPSRKHDACVSCGGNGYIAIEEAQS